ncbi:MULTISPECIES: ATP-binding protein [unclassified Breznakia]|uniref:tRNA lysidine(34) synthetase n=1 Tax=unclassified Breznakia TaxID=2623764 RepID=UPI002472F838|nr:MULTISPECIES: ATP-binding protein [unclassified Breznakia]MDH6366350.1 tRNA 2-thiocytidine biosynthesis protein TtcA [Breznakia sp. PH1-1]MDH6403443.1 tRNA 2-thiocytidine biosynthesis protein TtcA [Breznakia sp. PF1-11]MDH6411152.1 tRNA 2-thiocytidine biosynthesis protein TtcA [Breznakia sp. PFB1-11]MDH6413585.1 tRNA 2-thiocytidine biosynthesis protein TtcA [Breznakia sp. PFB1-14]MDH6415697.1 tRNA 2-thiocytidine biosynthesis protein TtcA [Breznakia sp. PFB1-4]
MYNRCMKKILKQLRKADEDFHLIESDDLIIVGVSGGKDSMLLLYALSLYQKFEHKKFRLLAVHLKMNFPDMDSTPIKDYCKKLGVEYYEEDTYMNEILTYHQRKDGSYDCSLCSTLKRGAIVNIAKERQATKICFAHHADDAIETFFLNAIYGGRLETFQPDIYYEDKEIHFIRPLIYTYEKDIKQAVKKYDLPIVESTCPNDGVSKREDMKQLVQSIYKIYPQADKNLLNMLSNENIHLWKKVTSKSER